MEEIKHNFSSFMSEALYGENGFYTKGGGAGRERDYLTSPEVGDYFAYAVANYINQWRRSMESDSITIVEIGCGSGSLCASLSRSSLDEMESIEYILVDISPEHRKTVQEKISKVNPAFTWSIEEEIPTIDQPCLIIANELLDNLVFDIKAASEVRAIEKPDDDYLIPDHIGIENLFEEINSATAMCSDVSLLLFDYMKPIANFDTQDWLRLYANQQRVVGVKEVLSALEADTIGDITTDVVQEQLHEILDYFGFSRIAFESQTDWINKYGPHIDDVHEESSQSAYEKIQSLVSGDSQKLQLDSFENEREILTDENGLGAFGVVTARRAV